MSCNSLKVTEKINNLSVNCDQSKISTISKTSNFESKSSGVRTERAGSYGWLRMIGASYSESSPLFVPAGVRTFINLSGLAANPPSRLKPPFDSHNFINSEGNFDPFKVSDFYLLRLNFLGKAALTLTEAELEFDIGDEENPIIVETGDISFPRAADKVKPFSIPLFFYSLDLFDATNGSFFVTSDQDCELWDFDILMSPTFTEDPA